VFDLSLYRIEKALAATDNPHLHLPPTIHVAGTNGKCSTITFMRSILENAGYKVHQFTSPHLLRVNERIYLAGHDISDEKLNELFQQLVPVAKECELSWFEFLTLIAMKAFADVPADVLLLETGLGGEFDATNVIPHSVASVITPISYDHKQYLGSTLTEIAKAKAGIIKQNVPVFSAHQEDEVKPILLQKARYLNSSLHEENKGWNVSREQNQWNLHFENESMTLPYPQKLLGSHQLQNAALAISTLKTLNIFPLTHSHICEGIRSAYMPGRLMPVKILPYESEIWFDGGHNPAAAEVLVDFFKERKEKPLTCIIGMLNTKNPKDFIDTLKLITGQFIFIPISHNSLSLSPADLCVFEPQALQAESLREALLKAKDNVLICGSFYLASEVMVPPTENKQ